MYRYLLLSIFFLFAPSLAALELAGVQVPGEVKVAESKLVLNGAGIRKATWFQVKVYVGALYLKQKSAHPQEIMESSEHKKLTMHFVRDVDADKLRDGWTAGFKNNGAPMAALAQRIENFNSSMADIKEGQSIELEFKEEQVDVIFAGTKKVSIAGRDFQRALLAIWLGPNPPNEDLKQGMLGKIS